MSCDINYWHGNALPGKRVTHATALWPHLKRTISHEKSHAMNLIGTPEIRTATSSSPRNRSKYTRPSSLRRGWVWDRDYMQYHRRWLSSECASNSGQQENMRLTGSVRLMKGTYTWRGGQTQQRCLGDREGAKCTYYGKELHGECVFELFLFSKGNSLG